MLNLLTTLCVLAAAVATPVAHEKRQPPVPNVFYISSVTANPSTIPWGGGIRIGITRGIKYEPVWNGLLLALGDSVYADQWTFDPSLTGQIKARGKCIDAGSNPGNGVRLKLWDCFDVPQQQWKVTGSHIKLVGYDLCMDVTDGNFGPGATVQTWKCYDGNPNQMWTLSQVHSW